MFNRTRFTLARKRRGMTKRSLAECVGITERSIVAYDSGSSLPSQETAEKIAQCLGFPKDFFFATDVDNIKPDAASFRALTKMTAIQRDKALGAGGIALLLNNWIEQRFELPTLDLPRLSSTEVERENNSEVCAEVLRQQWELGELPINNMITLLESRGIRIFSMAIDAREIDAFSMWNGDTPFIFLNTNKTSERCRFDAAHELGHLVMHRHGTTHKGPHAEREANDFASAFLMPRKSVLANAPRTITLPSLIAHKKYWTVSTAALNYRLHAIGLTTDWTYRTLCVQISQYGRDKEPEGATFETSQVLSKVFAALRLEGVSRSDVAEDLMIPVQEINELTFGLMLSGLNGGGNFTKTNNYGKTSRPTLEIVKQNSHYQGKNISPSESLSPQGISKDTS